MIVNSQEEFNQASPIDKAKALSEVIRMGLQTRTEDRDGLWFTPNHLREIADLLDALVSALERP